MGKDKIYKSIRKFFNKHPIVKFSGVIILLIAYILFAAKSHGLKDGITISLLTWSFFVLCTPIADGGILLDFPLRLITGIKMIYSELMVWIIAISLNMFTYLHNPAIYQKTMLLSLFKHIIDNPFPYWFIFFISAIGTYLSIYIGDIIINPKVKEKKHISFLIKYKIYIFAFIIIIILTVYGFLLKNLGINIPLI